MIQDTVVIGGECSLETRIEGDCDLTSMVEGDPDVLVVEGGGQTYPHYSGSYVVTPSTSVQTLDTSGKVLDDDVTIQAMPQGSATTPATIITADPTISVSSGGLITATVSKTQQITPTVQEGYVSAGTPGNVGVSGSNTEQLSVQGAQTIHPASTDQSIASGKYLTGAQTFKAVTVSGLTADKVLQGNVVKIGDADDDDRIMSVTGTASGGITPTGTKSITANGTGIDVYSYQYADVAVPNSYSQSDEGKVVSNGALVAQTSDTVTQNGTVDTTLINSLTVNVSGGSDTLGQLIGNTLTEYVNNDLAVTLPQYLFNGKTNLERIEMNSVTNIGQNALYNCNKLTSASLKSVQEIGASSLDKCAKLTVLVFPEFKRANGSSMRNCSKLEVVDLGKSTSVASNSYIAQTVFENNTVMDTLILRMPYRLTLNNVSTFNGTPFKNGGTGGTIYIPKSLYDHLGDGSSSDYKAATNWSTVNGYGTITWSKIEGSIYENAYADGTPI